MTPFIDEYIVDNYGSVAGVINPKSKYKVVIEAHADEISWFVNYITDQGLIYLKRNGGVDHQIAPAKRVWIHGKKGPVKAVFGWPAIHTRLSNPEQKEPQPKVSFGRYSDSYKDAKQYDSWDKALNLFEKEQYLTKRYIILYYKLPLNQPYKVETLFI